VLERVAAIEADARNAHYAEVDRQRVALLAGGIVARRSRDLADGGVGEGRGIELGSFFGVMVVPQADGVFGHSSLLRFAETFAIAPFSEEPSKFCADAAAHGLLHPQAPLVTPRWTGDLA
jgi:hypothetical protein